MPGSVEGVFASIFFPTLGEGLSKVLTAKGRAIEREEEEAYSLSLVRAIDRRQRALHYIHRGKIKGAGILRDIVKEWLQRPMGGEELVSLAKKVLEKELGEERGNEVLSMTAEKTLKALELLKKNPKRFLSRFLRLRVSFKNFLEHVYDRPSTDQLFEESLSMIKEGNHSSLQSIDSSFLKVPKFKGEGRIMKLLARPSGVNDYLAEVKARFSESNEEALRQYSLGVTLLGRGLYPKAVHHLSNSFKSLESKFAAYNTAIAYSGMEDLFMSKEYLEKALAIDPKFLHGWIGLASCYSILPGYGHDMFTKEIEMKHRREAISASKKVLELDPSNPIAYGVMGRCYTELGELGKAYESYKEAVKFDPDLALAWLNLAVLSSSLGKKDEALEYSLKAAELDPEMPQAWCNAGAFSCDLGKYEESVGYLENALRLDPKIPEIWLNLGAAYGGLNLKEKSEECFSRAKKIQEEYPFQLD